MPFLHSLTPVAKLPVEILGYIFLLATHNTPRYSNYDVEHPNNFRTPYRLAFVNRHWRSIALHLPKLWTDIYISGEFISVFPDHCEKDYQAESRRYFNGLASHLARSKTEPLEVFLSAQDPGWDELDDAEETITVYPIFGIKSMRGVMSALLPHLSRWRALTIYTDEWFTMYTALAEIRTAMTSVGIPLLESIDFKHANAVPDRGTDFFLDLIADPGFLNESAIDEALPLDMILPRLTSLMLNGVHTDWLHLSTILSNSPANLLELELQWMVESMRPSFEHLFLIFSACPLLETLVIRDAAKGELPAKAASLQSLKSLTIGYSSIPEAQKILDFIEAPNLETLSLECDDDELDSGALLSYLGTGVLPGLDEHPSSLYPTPQSPIPQPPSLAQRGIPFPRLENLRFTAIKADLPSLQVFYRTIPHVRTLRVMDGPSHVVLRALGLPSSIGDTQNANQSSCLPRLQSLCTITTDLNETNIQELTNLAQDMSSMRPANGDSGSELQNVHFYLNRGTSFTANKTVMVNMGCTWVNFLVNS